MYTSATELFWETLPTYIAIGMSPHEFWHGDPKLAKAYREAERIRRDNRYLSEWRAGRYVYEALLSASPAFREISKGIEHDYPKEPLFSTAPRKGASVEDENKARMEKNKAAFMAMAEKLNAELAERKAKQGER